MAVKTSYVDDHDGKSLDDDVTIRVVVGDREWSVNLSEKNINALQDKVQEFVPDVQADTVSETRAPRSSAKVKPANAGPADGTLAKRWAIKEGWTDSNGNAPKDKGAASKELKDAWKAAGSPVVEV